MGHNLALFLSATKHLYNWLCPSVIIHSFICSLIYSFIDSFIHKFISLEQAGKGETPQFIHYLIHSPIHSPIHSLIHSLIHPFTLEQAGERRDASIRGDM